MLLKTIRLNHFRNFVDTTVSISPQLTVILGENARGKTNTLEGIYFSMVGTGFREEKEDELLQWDAQKGLVETQWEDENNTIFFQISFSRKEERIEKKFSINKTVKPHTQYSQIQIRPVLFAPEQIEIISGSPSRRRTYFDMLISSFDFEYKKKLRNYEHALRKRNKVLEHYFSEEKLREELIFWNEYLEEQAFYIQGEREEYLDYLNKHNSIDKKIFRIDYIKNELTKKKLESCFDDEKKWRRTMIGPQKDDFHIYLVDPVEKNVHSFGSRSEQRLSIFWLKLNEISFYEEVFKKKPILLLDDIFSELDIKNSKIVMDLVQKYQTVLTTTEKEIIELIDVEKEVIKL